MTEPSGASDDERSPNRPSLKEMNRVFTIGSSYTRRDIHRRVGGSIQSYLPTADGRVVAVCLRLDTNPGAPNVILPGTGPGIEGAAATLVAARYSVPAFLKRDINDWEFVGMYRAVGWSTDPGVIAVHAKGARRADITSVIQMERTG